MIFVPLQSRSLHERGSAPKGFGFREVGCDNEIFEKLDIYKLCSARHEFLGNKE